MNTLSFTKFAALLGVAAGVCACTSLPAGYGQISGQKYNAVPIDTYPVQITSIDNRGTLDRLVFVDPGPRKVTVQGPPDGVSRYGAQHTIDLNVAPCTRYYLVAQKANRLSSDFTVIVDHQESIGGCSAAGMK